MSIATSAASAAAPALPNPLPPPNCTPYLTNGFDPLKSSFLTQPIFQLTYANGAQGQFNGVTCSIPDGVVFLERTQFGYSNSEHFMRTVSDFKYSFSVSVSAGLDGQKYSGSFSSSLTYGASFFSDVTKEYFLTFATQQCYSVRRDCSAAQASLTPGFTADLAALPATIGSSSDYQAYAGFFQKYGTYFLVSGVFGGFMAKATTISKSVVKTADHMKLQAAISGSFETEIGKVTGSASTSYNESQWLDQYQNDMSSTTSAVGGTYQPDKPAAFFSSCYDNPVLLLGLGTAGLSPVILPLSALITGPDATAKAATMDAAARVYLNTPHISTPDPVAASTLNQYDVDTILVAYTNYAVNGSRGYTTGSVGPADGMAVPCAYASGHLYDQDQRYANTASLALPVQKGLRAELAQTTTFGTAPEALFQRFALGQADGGAAVLGASSSLTVSAGTPLTQTAASDGFLLVSLLRGGSGARGSAAVTVGSVLRGAASIHYYPGDDVHYPQESVLVPICNGETYTVTCDTTFGDVTYAAQWTPLSGVLSFQPAQQMLAYGQTQPSQLPLTVQNVQTDGFLILLIDGRSCDQTIGFGAIEMGPAGTPLGTDATMAAASINFYPGADTWLGCNSAVLPVPKGWSYNVTFNYVFAQPSVALCWVPLVNPTDPTQWAGN